MTFVTLTTDFGHKDYSIAVIKAALLSQIPGVNIIDISHQISPYNHSETAYILKNSYAAFPNGSIHIIGVESEFTPENIHLAMEFDGHFFIGADNGIFSLIKEELKSNKIVAINIHKSVITSFPVLDVFVKVACHIARGGTLEIIGKLIETIKPIKNIIPFYFSEAAKASQSKDYKNAESLLTGLSDYQKIFGGTVMLSDDKLEAEIRAKAAAKEKQMAADAANLIAKA